MGDDRFVFDERFAEAFLHGDCRRVMGVRLQPFSYWHKVQLEYVQSKVLLGNPGLWDVWVAARVCATRYPRNASFPKAGNLWYLGWHLCHGWRGFRKNLGALMAHIGDYASPPKLWSGKGSSKTRLAEALEQLGKLTDDPARLAQAEQWRNEAALEGGKQRDIDDSIEQVSIFMKHASRPAEEAWNMPMGELLWYNACFLKMEGAEVPIWTPMDEAIFEQHKKSRYMKIVKIAEEMRAENPSLTPDLSLALAAVRYWEKVVESQQAASR
jgi:hypothetical protein